MNLTVDRSAANWYKDELEIGSKAYIRFFPRYGFGGHIPGFSIGINHDDPEDVHVSTEVNNITFYVESKDAWYFEDVNLTVKLNNKLNEPEFTYN